MNNHYYSQSDYQIPLSQGDLFQTNQYLNMIQGGNLPFFRRYLLVAKYFMNLFIVSGDEDFEEIWPLVMFGLTHYGKCALKKMGDYWTVFALAKVNEERQGRIIQAKGVLLSNFSFMTDLSKLTQIPLSDKDTVFFKRDMEGLPLLLYWWDTIEQFCQYDDIIATNKVWLTKKAIMELRSGNDAHNQEEIRAMLDYRSPILKINAAPSKNGFENANLLEPFDTPSDNQILTIETAEKYQNFMYGRLGVRHNTIKAERKITDEADAEMSQFDILEYDTRKFLDVAIKRLNKLYNINITLECIFDGDENNEISVEKKGENNERYAENNI